MKQYKVIKEIRKELKERAMSCTHDWRFLDTYSPLELQVLNEGFLQVCKHCNLLK